MRLASNKSAKPHVRAFERRLGLFALFDLAFEVLDGAR